MEKKEDKEITPAERLKKLLKSSVFERVVAIFAEVGLKDIGCNTLTEKQKQAIMISIQKENKISEAKHYENIYNALLQFTKVMIGYRDKYREEAAKLTGLINVYETQLKVAEKLSNGVKSGAMRVEHSADEDKEKPFILYLDKVNIAIYADGRTDVLIDGEDGLYEEMRKQSKRTSITLSLYKTYIETVSEYLYEDTEHPLWALCPRNLEMMLEYPDFIEEQNKKGRERYFRFKLNQKRENGETITPDMEKWALYPDYNEVEEANNEVALMTLNKFLEQWEVQRKK